MPPSVHITSPTNPRVKQVVKLRNHRDRRKTGLFIAEGTREVGRAVAAGLTVREVFLCPELLANTTKDDLGTPLAQRAAEVVRQTCPGLELQETQETQAAQKSQAAQTTIAWAEVTAPVFRKMAYLREPEGLLAVVEQPVWTLDRLPTPGAHALYLLAVGIEKPGNLGAMVRTAEAAGCEAVLVADQGTELADEGVAAGETRGEPRTPVDAFNPNAIRASTCAVFSLPTIAASAAAMRDWLIAHHVRLQAATPHGAVAHTAADWRGPVAVAIGPEDTGLSDSWLHVADQTAGQRIAIAMHGRLVDSLNASTAAAILLFEARRPPNLATTR